MDIVEPSPDGAAEVSQQLHAIARLLGIKEQESQQAGQLIDTINKSVALRMSALPQAFHEAVLPEGALSERQARPCSLPTSVKCCAGAGTTRVMYISLLPKARHEKAMCRDYKSVALLSACKSVSRLQCRWKS